MRTKREVLAAWIIGKMRQNRADVMSKQDTSPVKDAFRDAEVEFLKQEDDYIRGVESQMRENKTTGLSDMCLLGATHLVAKIGFKCVEWFQFKLVDSNGAANLDRIKVASEVATNVLSSMSSFKRMFDDNMGILTKALTCGIACLGGVVGGIGGFLRGIVAKDRNPFVGLGAGFTEGFARGFRASIDFYEKRYANEIEQKRTVTLPLIDPKGPVIPALKEALDITPTSPSKT